MKARVVNDNVVEVILMKGKGGHRVAAKGRSDHRYAQLILNILELLRIGLLQ